jgi:hypothetical protein
VVRQSNTGQTLAYPYTPETHSADEVLFIHLSILCSPLNRFCLVCHPGPSVPAFSSELPQLVAVHMIDPAEQSLC